MAEPPVFAKSFAVITNNTFNLSGGKTRGVSLTDISNAHLSVNRFTGDAETAVYVSGTSTVSGWTITANKGLGDFGSARTDIFLDQKTSGCIVGEGQGAAVENLGSDNTILPQL